MKNRKIPACNAPPESPALRAGIALRAGTLTAILLALGFLALSPIAQAVSPAPDGGYPGFNTAEGQNALLNLDISTGFANTAIGWFSLQSNVKGSFNTAVGAGTLVLDIGDPNTGEGVDNTAVGAAALLLNTTGANNTANGTATLVHNSIGNSNTAMGAFALNNNTTGNGNTASGGAALQSNLTGSLNTADGFFALANNSAGDDNTAIGTGALFFNTASGNTAIGSNALVNNTTGGTLANIQGFDVGPNVAVGQQALESNTVASANTAVGYQALHSFTIGPMGLEQLGLCTAVGFQALANADGNGAANNAFGYQALKNNTGGAANTAIGGQALFNNLTGNSNVAVGNNALVHNDTGQTNTAIGFGALQSNTGGGDNLAIGNDALGTNAIGNDNTAVGTDAGPGVTGSNNTILGFNAGGGIAAANNVICIGTDGQNIDNSCYIGNIYTNVQPIVGTDPDSVTVRNSGKLGRGNVSSRRYKHDIQPMAGASEALFKLKPVSFRYNKEYDATQTIAFGLIAEDVAEAYPDLVGRNAKGQPESVRYEQVNAMLLNEFIKEHEKVEDQQAAIAELRCTTAEQEVTIEDLKSTVAQQQKGMDALVAHIKKQDSKIQKVSDQVEMSKAAPKVVLNNP
jgi:uncharacterized coiled-coil protein SlyX